MATPLTSSNQFADLVSQLHNTPNDPVLKKAIVQNLPKMIALAKDNPMALFHLAYIYPPTSSQFKHTIRQSANLGCTNAQLVMGQLLVKSNEPGDLKKAVHYMTMIEKSDDSYIKNQAKTLLEECPKLALAMQEQAKPNLSYHRTYGFFAPQGEREVAVANTKTCTL